MSILKKIFGATKKGADGEFNFESIVGEKCTVTEKIDSFAGCGQVKVFGQLWAARGAYDNDTFDVGDSLMIVAIEGVKLICKKI